MLYDRPIYYMISHILFGFIAVWYPWLGIIALSYQVGQYLFNVRVFPVEGRILQGNTIQHTGLKIAEMGLGYIIGYAIRYICD